MQHLFLFTIGPVQSFIAQARKTQDLYAGSRILSDLVHFAMAKTKQIGIAEIISPFLKEEDYLTPSKEFEKSIPNRFLTLIKENDSGKVQKMAQDMECKVKNEFQRIVKKNLNNFLNKNDIESAKGLFEQTEDFLEVFWAIKPFDQEKEQYNEAYKELERFLGAIKNTRVFRQTSEVGRKCSVNGEYNVKVYRKTDKENDGERLYKKKLFSNDVFVLEPTQKHALKQRHIQQGEGLSAISLLKRVYRENIGKSGEWQNFPSTAGITLLNLYNAQPQTFEQWRKIFESTNPQDDEQQAGIGFYDEQLYFDFKDDKTVEELFSKRFWDAENNCSKLKNSKEDIKRFYEEQLKPIAKLPTVKESTYYALIRFDGDSMGEWLGKVPDYKKHQEFSKLLINFAQKAKALIDGEMVEKCSNINPIRRGRAIYAGGDDFIGFLNINYLFETLEHLHNIFQKEVTEQVPFKNIDNTNEEKLFTFSTGVCVAHYKDPLKVVLAEAKEMEKQAKKVKDKAAFGISVIKGSGEMKHFVLKNQATDSSSNAAKFQHLINDLKPDKDKGYFSDKFIKNLGEEFMKLVDKNGNVERIIFEAELKRLIKRAANLKGEKEELEQRMKTFIELAISLYNESAKASNQFENYMSLLYTATFLERETNPKA